MTTPRPTDEVVLQEGVPQQPPYGPDDIRVLRSRTIRTLLVTQTLGSVGVSAGFAISAIVATSLAGSSAEAGVAASLATVATVIATLVLARLTSAFGRRSGLGVGYTVAAAGAFTCATAIGTGSFALFMLGGGLFGVAAATNFQARFAAADLAAPGTSAQGISLVVWVSTVGAVIGPNTAALGDRMERWFGISGLATAYLVSGVCFASAAVLVTILLRPDPLLTARKLWGLENPGKPPRRRLRDGAIAIASSARARFAIASSVSAHAVMVGVMTWTPVHMAHGVGHGVIGLVLSGHLLGMYAFSPVFGWAATRYGVMRVIAAGSFVMLMSLGLAASSQPHDDVRLGAALFLLGVAWSLMFITGSSLLTESVEPERRASAQGVFDVSIWTGAAVSLAVSGWVLGDLGYRWLCALCLVIVLPVAIWAIPVAAARRGPGRPSSRSEDRTTSAHPHPDPAN